MRLRRRLSDAARTIRPWPSRLAAWILADGVRRDTLALSVLFAVGRIVAVWGRQPLRYPDSPGYLKIDFFGHAVRLWAVPLVFRPLPSDQARVIVQTGIAIVCWSALAFAAARTVRDPLVARLTPALILVLGLCVQVTEWDITILSESIAISLTALLIALVLRVYRRPSPRTVVAILVVLTFWTFTRQLQAGVVVPLAVVVALVLAIRSRRHLPVVLVLLAIASWSAFDNSQSHGVTAGTAHDLLVFRIFPTKGGPEFFAKRGMPYVAEFRQEARAGIYLGDRSPTRNDPRWLAWVREHWLWSYARWLLQRPGAEINDAVVKIRSLLSGYPAYSHPRTVLPSGLQDTFWGRRTADLPVWGVMLVFLILFSAVLTRRFVIHPLAAAVIVASLIWYFVGYLFGQLELARISIPPGASLRIGLILLGVGLLDSILRWRVLRAESRQPA